MVHLIYCDNTGKQGERELDNIMNGTKTMVIRGAAGRKIPHSRVFEGETVYFMEKGTKQITAKASVNQVKNYVKLTDEEIHDTLEKHQEALQLSDKQRARWHKKCLCLVAFEDVEAIEPRLFDHQGNMDDWLIIDKIEDVIVGTSIPFNYENAKLNSH